MMLKTNPALWAWADSPVVSALICWDRLNFLAPVHSSFIFRTEATLEEASWKASNNLASLGDGEVELWLPLIPVNEGS